MSVGLRGTRVLVVDDEPRACEAAAWLLRVLGAEVVVAYSGREAWQHLLDREFDVLLSDLDMPEVDGYELVRKARLRGLDATKLRAIALTGSDSEEQREKAEASGFDVLIVKPATVQDLATAITPVKGNQEASGGVSS